MSVYKSLILGYYKTMVGRADITEKIIKDTVVADGGDLDIEWFINATKEGVKFTVNVFIYHEVLTFNVLVQLGGYLIVNDMIETRDVDGFIVARELKGFLEFAKETEKEKKELDDYIMARSLLEEK